MMMRGTSSKLPFFHPVFAIAIISSLSSPTVSFSLTLPTLRNNAIIANNNDGATNTLRPTSSLRMTSSSKDERYDPSSAETTTTMMTTTRRDMMFAVTTAATTAAFWNPSASLAAGGIGTDPEHPIAVIGAGGRCGLLATEALASQNLYARAITRNGREVLSSPSPYVSSAAGDVTSLPSLAKALEGCSGAIFAASASKTGGDAAHVDYLGVVNAAKACVEDKVGRLVVISSLAVTRPESLGFKITNVFGRIMDYKVAGEVELRNIYATAPSSLSYTIVRPGGLSDASADGPPLLVSSQGDLLSGEVSREDVAKFCVAAVIDATVPNTTMELFAKKGIGKSVKTLPEVERMSLLRHDGAGSYEGLLKGLFTDEEMGRRFGDVVSGYKGTKVESLESLS